VGTVLDAGLELIIKTFQPLCLGRNGECGAGEFGTRRKKKTRRRVKPG